MASDIVNIPSSFRSIIHLSWNDSRPAESKLYRGSSAIIITFTVLFGTDLLRVRAKRICVLLYRANISVVIIVIIILINSTV